MADKTLRAIGATVVLVAIGVYALTQTGSGEPDSVEIDNPAASTADPVASIATDAAPEEFEYRVGLLSAPTTDNFWAYVGAEPTVWNSYVLGPTKPALFALDADQTSLVGELSSGAPANPTWDASGWRVRVDLGSGPSVE